MGSPCEIKLYSSSRSRASQLVHSAVEEVRRLECKYSRYRTDSFLSEINRIALTGGCIDVDPETAGLLDYVATCYDQSGGLFDVTSGVLRQAWQYKGKDLPRSDAIQALLTSIGWSKLRWHSPTLEFPYPGLELDLGGAVKEFAVDRVAALLGDSGAQHGLINLGGDIRVIGPHPGGDPWVVGITHPRMPGTFIRTLYLTHGAMATSGDYERCMVIDGVRYGHVLNPKTGWPVRTMASVSVIADYCLIAGSASTIAMLKENEGPTWLESLGLPCFWMDVDGREGGSIR